MKINGKRLVLIEWVDSLGVGGQWESLKDRTDDPEEFLCYSAGWLIIDGERNKVIVPHIHDTNENLGAEFSGCGDMTIPTSAVRRIVDLKAGKK